jgi:hypothetical protein
MKAAQDLGDTLIEVGPTVALVDATIEESGKTLPP